MKQQISVSQYRNIDLTIMTVLLAIVQAVIHFAASVWFPEQLYVISPVALVTALVMMRWSGWAAVPAVVGGVVFTALSGGTVQHYVIYAAGNMVSMLALLLVKFLGKEKIRDNVVYTLVFGLCVQALMLLGRAAAAALLGFEADACLGFITTDTLSIIFTLCGIWAVRRIDGLFEDQIHYLLRIQSEQSIEGREQL